MSRSEFVGDLVTIAAVLAMLMLGGGCYYYPHRTTYTPPRSVGVSGEECVPVGGDALMSWGQGTPNSERSHHGRAATTETAGGLYGTVQTCAAREEAGSSRGEGPRLPPTVIVVPPSRRHYQHHDPYDRRYGR